jgi:hypothetical protein
MVVCAPMPNLYIFCATLNWRLMDEVVLTNYRVFFDQFLRFIPFWVAAGAALFFIGRRLKRGQQ